MKVHLTDLAIRKLPLPTAGQIDVWDNSTKGFGIRLSYRGARTFILKRDNRRFTIGHWPATTLSEARAEANRRKYIALNPASISYADARELFIEQHCNRNQKASTAKEATHLMKRFPLTGRVDGITLHDINRILKEMPPGSANSAFNVFRTFLNWCVAQQYLTHSVLNRAKRPHPIKSRERVLSEIELRAVWRETGYGDPFGTISRLLVLTGQRLNQISSLQRQWVKDDRIEFPGEVMKSNRSHVIPLTPMTRQLLDIIDRVQTATYGARCLPFHYFISGGLDKPFCSHSSGMEKLRAHLPSIPHFTCHDFRRGFSTLHSRIRTPIDVTEALLQHLSGSRTPIQRIYDRHDRWDEMRTAMFNYEEALLAIFNE